MDLNILAQNIRRLRTAKRLSQKALAEAAGLSVPAISKIELGKGEPRVRTLQAIARALDARLQLLFSPARELKAVRFRSTKRLQFRENILAGISRWLDDFNYLESVLDERRPFLLREIRDLCSRNDIVEAAGKCRKKLNLRETEPIHDICGIMERAGVKVYPVPMASDGFFGLSIGEEDAGPAVVVNVWERISVERRIYSAAHELGHLMLHQDAYDVNTVVENSNEEHEADMFAAHFLLPDKGFRKEWNEAAGLHWVDRVFKVKRIYSVSYKVILRRLIDCGAADNSIWKKFNFAHQQRFKRKLSYKEEPCGLETEPFGLKKFDFYEDRLSRLTRKAVEGDKISVSRGAEILQIGIEEMQDLLNNWEKVL